MKYRYQILLETGKDLKEFVNIATRLQGKIVVVDGEGLCVSARSLLGMRYAMTFSELWCEAENDVYNAFEKFII